jgi:DNA-binding response OmpR family regulator
MAQILLVGAEEMSSALLTRGLEESGYQVGSVNTGEEALAEIDRRRYDLAVVALGDRDGLDLVQQIRTRSELPVILVSSRDGEADMVAALEIGADDFVAASFTPRAVAARVKAVLRRARRPAMQVVMLQDVEIRVQQHEVLVDGRTVDLTAREFDVLLYLADHAGEVVTREELLDKVWGMEFPGGTRTVDVHIAQVRRKLGRPSLIRTVRGVGYKALRYPGQAAEQNRRDEGRPEALSA